MNAISSERSIGRRTRRFCAQQLNVVYASGISDLHARERPGRAAFRRRSSEALRRSRSVCSSASTYDAHLPRRVFRFENGVLVYRREAGNRRAPHLGATGPARRSPRRAGRRTYGASASRPTERGRGPDDQDRDGKPEIWVLDSSSRRPESLDLRAVARRPRLPVWSPDGNRIVYSSADGRAARDLSDGRSDGGAPRGTPLESDRGQVRRRLVARRPRSSSSSARRESRQRFGSGSFSLRATGRPFACSGRATSQDCARFSPDGRWFPYASDESGNNEVYVTRFPAAHGKWQVSTGGARGGRLESGRREMYYVSHGSATSCRSSRVGQDGSESGIRREALPLAATGFRRCRRYESAGRPNSRNRGRAGEASRRTRRQLDGRTRQEMTLAAGNAARSLRDPRRRSARAEWARSTGRGTRGWSGRSRSRCCRSTSPRLPRCGSGSSGRRRRSRSSRTRTSARSTTSGTRTASSTWSWSTWRGRRWRSGS